MWPISMSMSQICSSTICLAKLGVWSPSGFLGIGVAGYRFDMAALTTPTLNVRALEKLNFTHVNGKPIQITLSHEEPSISKSDAGKIYIMNLEKEMDNEALHEIFSSFGHILSCKVAKDASGQSMGYGFVQFSGKESARKAIAELNGVLLKGKKVCVRPYLSKQERELLVDKENFTNVFIKNFCKSATEEDLKNIFGEFGLITSAQVMRNNDGTSKCFGFVNFANSNDAARAVESLNAKIFEKKKWFVGRAQKKFERQQQMECVKEAFDKGSNLYVKNLDYSIGDKKLKDLFSPFGSVTSCGVMQDEKGISTGRGMVAFALPEEASRALSEMNGKILGGKPLYVTLALRKGDRSAWLQSLEKGVIEVQNDVLLNEKQVCEGNGLGKQEKELSLDKTNFTNVFVKNLCESTTEDELKHIFGEFGKITSTMVLRNKDGTSKCLGFVCFKNTVDAARAVESLDGHNFGNKKWFVQRAHHQSETQLKQKHNFEELVKESVDKRSNLHVKNLDQSIDDEKLKELFSKFGSVTSCRVMLDKNGISKRRGFIAFSSPEEASTALSEMNGKIIVDKPIYIALTQRKEDRITLLQNLDKEIDHKALHGIVEKLNCIVGKLNVVIGELNGMLLNGKGVYAGPVLNKKANNLLVYSANLGNVFVENLCDTMTEDDLKNIFVEFGPITSAVVMRNEDGTSKCFGIVSFENVEDSARAVESLKGRKFDTKSCYVVKKTVDKWSNLHVKNQGKRNGGGKLSEVFSPFRSYYSVCEVNGKNVVSRSLCVALSLRKENRRVGLQAVPSTMDKGFQPVPAISQQILPRFPVGPFASSLLANASPLGRRHCLVKFCTRLLNSWSLRY